MSTSTKDYKPIYFSQTITKQSGTDNTFFVKWSWRCLYFYNYNGTKKIANRTKVQYDKLGKIIITWSYQVDGRWYTGSTDTKTYTKGSKDGTSTDGNSSYSPPDNATNIKCSVSASSLTYTEKIFVAGGSDKTETHPYFNKQTVTCTLDLTTDKYGMASIEVPSIEVSTKNYKILCDLNSYSDTANNNLGTAYIIYRITNGTSYKDSPVLTIVNGRATYTSSNTYSPGAVVTVQARVCRGTKPRYYGLWSDLTTVILPPAAPKAITASLNSNETQCTVSWYQNLAQSSRTTLDKSVTSYTIEYATATKYFDNSSNVTSTTTGTLTGTLQKTGSYKDYYKMSYIVDISQGNTYYFRVKATNDNGDSTWSDISAGYTFGKEPTAPTTWSNVSNVLLGETIYLYWVHNSVDGSYQRSATVYWRKKDAIAWAAINWTNTNENDEEQAYITLSTSSFSGGDVIQWYVKTKGVLDTYSPASVIREINICVNPTVSISVDSTFNTYPFNINIEANGGNGNPVSFTMSIVSKNNYNTIDDYGDEIRVMEGSIIWSTIINNSETTFTKSLTPLDVHFEDGQEYTVSVTITSSNGMTNTDTEDFTVEFDEDDIAYYLDTTFSLYSEDGAPYLIMRPYCFQATYDDDTIESIISEPGFTISVYRVDFDGTYTEIAADIEAENGVYVLDPHPSLTTATYRLVATDNNTISKGTMFSNTVQYDINNPVICLTWDETYSNYTDTYTASNEDADDIPSSESPSLYGQELILPYNIDISEDSSVDVSLVEYIGRSHPVSYYGTQVGQTSSWSCDIEATDTETLSKLRKLQIYTGDIYCRAPNGIGYWAKVGVSFSKTHAAVTIPVKLSLTRVEGGE